MPEVKKVVNRTQNSDIVVVNQTRDYSDEPFFVEKAEKAKAFLKAHPVPDWIINSESSLHYQKALLIRGHSPCYFFGFGL